MAAAIAVADIPAVRAVEDHHHVFETLLLIDILQNGQHGALEQIGAYHEDRPVGRLLDNLRISHDVNGRTVNE